ncbi:PEPxxWA-CTERM sorting domain-containing protein [uncultured Sphingomonas sp.]|uniref:PEPxxWA-CTERM sorting domain-containing protein n=1 Tax=uncultured Sphingomonas sp. TaxID=158754 RepID=UPI0035CB0A33
MGFARIGGNAWRQVAGPTAVLLLAPVALTATGPAGVGAVIAAIADPMAVMAGRSPGVRPAGALTQSKQRRLATPGPRSEHVLPRVRQHPGGVVPADYVPGDAIPFGEIGPEAVTPVTPIAFAAPVGGGGGGVGGFTGGAFGGGGGGGGSGSGGGGDTSTPVVTTPPLTASVPEPATWATLLLGMAVAGIALRRRPAPRAVPRRP